MAKGKGTVRYASLDAMPAGVRAAAARALGSGAAPAAPPYRPAQPSASPPVARGRPRHEAGRMNATEAAYASHLEWRKRQGEVLWYAFEAIRLRLADKTTLTVDFFVLLADLSLEAHEVKGGHWEDDARVKVKVAAEQFPFRFIAAQKVAAGWKFEQFGERTP
jgi:hypothetical protein